MPAIPASAVGSPAGHLATNRDLLRERGETCSRGLFYKYAVRYKEGQLRFGPDKNRRLAARFYGEGPGADEDKEMGQKGERVGKREGKEPTASICTAKQFVFKKYSSCRISLRLGSDTATCCIYMTFYVNRRRVHKEQQTASSMARWAT